MTTALSHRPTPSRAPPLQAILSELNRFPDRTPLAERLGEASRAGAARAWRWASLEVLLYGTECFGALLAARQRYVDFRTLDAAARLVQRYFRGRLFQRFVRINREMIAERREEAARRKAALLEHHVSKVQTAWRGFIVRRILTDVAQASVGKERERQEGKLAELRARRRQLERNQQEDRSAGVIQRIYQAQQ